PSRSIICQIFWRISDFVMRAGVQRDLSGRYTRVCRESIERTSTRVFDARAATREDEEAGVRDHAMLRTHAALADVPEPEQRFERRNRAERVVRTQRVDRLLHLERGRHEGGEHRARTERRGRRAEELPRLGEV